MSKLDRFKKEEGKLITKCKRINEFINDTFFSNFIKVILYYKRKFDLRCFTLFTSINGNSKGTINIIYLGYWYTEGYIRTSSFEFSVKGLDKKFVHLTNDAI